MSFKRGGSFSNFSQFQADPEALELEEIGQQQKTSQFQYFGGFQQKGRGGSLRQAGVGGNRSMVCRDDIPSLASTNGRGLPGGGPGAGQPQRVKPGKEIYRPPTASWNIDEAQEFKPLCPAPLTSSRSVDFGPGSNSDGLRSGPTGSESVRSGLTITVKPEVKGGTRHVESNTELDVTKLGVFGQEMEEVIKQTLDDPNSLSARSHMELVRQIFTKVVETQKISELAAKFCIYIIERERRETFLESLLNTCQEWYHERDRIIRSENKSGKWAAFMSFLNELYGLLKRKQVQLQSKYEGVAPKLVLLTLLAECCIVTLTQTQMFTIPETEVLFLVLTHIQRDLMTEAPGQMTLIVNCLREAFLMTEAPAQVRKTLLQLLELQSAGWQLPAEAVMYYYPGAKL